MSLEVVELDGVAWESVPFTLYLGRELSDDEQEALRLLVDDWYAEGSRGIYGGPMHDLDAVGFDEDQSGAHTAEWMVDMGDAEERALAELARRLEEFGARTKTPLERLVLGTIVVG
jgi:hypothetical protein